MLAEWGSSKPLGLFSVTSNIDGHWQRTQGVGQERLCVPPPLILTRVSYVKLMLILTLVLSVKFAAAAGTRFTAR